MPNELGIYHYLPEVFIGHLLDIVHFNGSIFEKDCPGLVACYYQDGDVVCLLRNSALPSTGLSSCLNPGPDSERLSSLPRDCSVPRVLPHPSKIMESADEHGLLSPPMYRNLG